MTTHYMVVFEDFAGHKHGLLVDDLSKADHNIKVFMDGQPYKIIETNKLEYKIAYSFSYICVSNILKI